MTRIKASDRVKAKRNETQHKPQRSVAKPYVLPKGKVLILRTCNADMSSRNDFVWPTYGKVKCNDWIANNKCGNGLHGFLWGEGDGTLASWKEDAKWLVVEVAANKVIDLQDKVKFPEGKVVCCGSRAEATQFLHQFAPRHAIIGLMLMTGNYSKVTAGYGSKVNAGDCSNVTAGDESTVNAGYGSNINAGNDSNVNVGKYSIVTAGYGSIVTAGNCSKVNAGYDSTVTAGVSSKIDFAWWDYNASRSRTTTAYVGENGIVPNIAYKCVNGKVVKA